MQFSLAAKVAAILLDVLLTIALCAVYYHKGEVAGAAEVQQKWDAQQAQVANATTAAVTTAASEALANYKAAGASVQQADTHKAQQVAISADLKQQVTTYAKKQMGTQNAAGTGGSVSCAGGSGIDADGLRIWNTANAAARGDTAIPASNSAPSAVTAVRYDSSTGNTGRQPSNDAGQSCGRGAGAGRMQCQ